MSRNFELLQKAEQERQNVSDLPREVTEATSSAPRENIPLPAQYQPFISLVHRVFLVPAPKAPRVVIFAGVDRGSGCTWVCANTAKVIGQLLPGSVCLVDANLHSPRLHHHFAADLSQGLTGPPTKPVPTASSPRISLLSPHATSQTGNNGTTGISDIRLHLTKLRRQFDYVLIDTPSLDSNTDAIVLAAEADGLILVIGANSSRREVARVNVERLRSAQVPLLGSVLNRRAFPIPEFIYRKL